MTVQSAPDTGTDGTLTICEDAPAVDLFLALGGTPDRGGVWTPTLSSGTGVFDPAVDSGGTYTYQFSAADSCSSTSSNVVVTLETAPNAGISGSIELCIIDAPIDLITVLGGTPDLGGIWTPTLTSGTGVFNPRIDLAGTYTYTVGANSNCNFTDSATSTVTIQPIPNAGRNGSLSICENLSPVDLFDSLGGFPTTGGTWNPVLASGSGIFDPTVDAPGRYTYSIFSGNPCNITATASVIVTILELPDAGVDANLDLCSTDAAVDLFTILGGTPDAGGVWSPALSSGSGVFDPSLDTAGVYTYTVAPIAPCTTNASATATVTIQTPPDAGTDGSVDLCEDAGTVDLFTVLGGTPDAGGTWSPALNSGSGVFDPTVDVAGTYTYTLTNTVCTTPSSSQVVVTVQELPDAGTDANLDLCSTDAAVDLFTILGRNTRCRWSMESGTFQRKWSI